jgi:phosphoribosylformylglycinamidine cyclo-ligase
MVPTRLYVKPLLALHRAGLLRAAAHITGGGLVDNVPRALPTGLCAVIDRPWPVPPVFSWLASAGSVSAAEMLRVFNCGIGMALIVSNPQEASAVLAEHGETPRVIGQVVEGDGDGAARFGLPDGWLR